MKQISHSDRLRDNHQKYRKLCTYKRAYFMKQISHTDKLRDYLLKVTLQSSSYAHTKE